MADNYANFPYRTPKNTFFPNIRAIARTGAGEVKRLAAEGDYPAAAGEAVSTVLGVGGGALMDLYNTVGAVTQPPARALEQLVTGQASPPRSYAGLGFGGDQYQNELMRARANRPAVAPETATEVPPVVAPTGGGGEPGAPALPGRPDYGDHLARTKEEYVAPTAAQNAARDEFLRNQQARPMPSTRFTRPVKAVNPMKGVALPQLSGPVNLNDLMKFRLNMINAGVQMLPRVAAAAQADTMREEQQANQALALKNLQLGQDRAVAQANLLSKGLDREARLEAARIRAAGSGPDFADALALREDVGTYKDMFIGSAAGNLGTVPDAMAEIAERYNDPIGVESVYNTLLAQSGEVDPEAFQDPAKVDEFITRVNTAMQMRHQGQLPARPQ